MKWALLWAALLLLPCMPAFAEDDRGAGGVSQDQYQQSGSAQKTNDGAEAAQEGAGADRAGGSCSNPQEVASVGPTTDNSVTPFDTTGRTFRVSYTVSGIEPREAETVDIDIEDRFGLVDFAMVEEDGTDNFIVTEEAGSFELVVNISPQNSSAEYTVTVEDCGGSDGGNGGPDDDQYDNGEGDVDDPDDVVPGTGADTDLPATGGVSVLFGAVALALAAALLARRILAA